MHLSAIRKKCASNPGSITKKFKEIKAALAASAAVADPVASRNAIPVNNTYNVKNTGEKSLKNAKEESLDEEPMITSFSNIESIANDTDTESCDGASSNNNAWKSFGLGNSRASKFKV